MFPTHMVPHLVAAPPTVSLQNHHDGDSHRRLGPLRHYRRDHAMRRCLLVQTRRKSRLWPLNWR